MPVFVRREDNPKQGFNMAVLLSKTDTKGDVGIEIEVEGNKFQKENVPYPWKYVHDGSLRGKDNAEYVLKFPISFGEVPNSLKTLWDMFKTYGSVLDDSNRTSVHVHLNVQKWHMNRLTSFFAIYYALEEVLTAWCGDHRVGNLFCLRAKDAPAIIRQVRAFIRTDGRDLMRDNHHYAALNTSALKKFGSLEVRTLRGPQDPQIIVDWVAILERLYHLSAEYPDPRGICDAFSQMGPLAFFEMMLGDKVGIVRQGVEMTDEDIRDSMYEGIRLAQDLCYCRDWDSFKPMEINRDPFGRDTLKLAKKLALAQVEDAEDYPPPPSGAFYQQIIAAHANPFLSPNIQWEETVPVYDEDD